MAGHRPTIANSSNAAYISYNGDDSYAPVGNAFGYATMCRGGEWREYAPSTGLFFDIGGKDTYIHARAGDNSEWIHTESPGQHGYGIDAPAGMLRFEQK